jgi:hypothetical protein
MTATAGPAPAAVDFERFVAATNALAELLERETQALRSPGAAIAAMQGPKEHLTRLYLEQGQALRSTPDALDEAAPAQRQAARRAAQRLAVALEANERQLRAATLAADRIVAAIVGAVREQRVAGLGYARPRAPQRHVAAAASGVTLDRRL